MATSILKRTYKCWNDCKPEGCPSHVATLVFQSVSDALTFDDGKGRGYQGQTPEFEALLSMINELSLSRVEIETMIKNAHTE